jgi:hypothetical protein
MSQNCQRIVTLPAGSGGAVVNIPGTNLTGATSVLVRKQHFGRSKIFLFLLENNWSMFHLMHSQLA